MQRLEWRLKRIDVRDGEGEQSGNLASTRLLFCVCGEGNGSFAGADSDPSSICKEEMTEFNPALLI